MPTSVIAPEAPEIQLEFLEDLSPQAEPGFLRVVRRRLRAHYPDGTQSQPFVYDEVDRKAIDAVVIVAHYADADGRRFVYLRSALRPPVVFRDRTRSPIPAQDPASSIWELPAGLVEPGEQSREGLLAGAARELGEELGFDVAPGRLRELGPSTFPAPGIIAERHFYFAVLVEPATRREPDLDGSALEHGGLVLPLPLEDALSLCRTGGIVDAKTELGLRRLREAYP
jgi:ADP-ribose pyrophosphatase